MNTELSELLKREAEYAQAHKDAPVGEGTTVTHRGQRSRIFSLRLSEAEPTMGSVMASKHMAIPRAQPQSVPDTPRT